MKLFFTGFLLLSSLSAMAIPIGEYLEKTIKFKSDLLSTHKLLKRDAQIILTPTKNPFYKDCFKESRIVRLYTNGCEKYNKHLFKTYQRMTKQYFALMDLLDKKVEDETKLSIFKKNEHDFFRYITEGTLKDRIQKDSNYNSVINAQKRKVISRFDHKFTKKLIKKCYMEFGLDVERDKANCFNKEAKNNLIIYLVIGKKANLSNVIKKLDSDYKKLITVLSKVQRELN